MASLQLISSSVSDNIYAFASQAEGQVRNKGNTEKCQICSLRKNHGPVSANGHVFAE